MHNLTAVLSMLLGIGLTRTILKKHFVRHETVVAGLYTASSVILRSAFMVLVNYSLLRFPPPVGYGFDEAAIPASLPLMTIFDLTLALYTIPIAYSLAKISGSSLKKSNLDLNQ